MTRENKFLKECIFFNYLYLLDQNLTKIYLEIKIFDKQNKQASSFSYLRL